MNLRDRAIELGAKITALRSEVAELENKRNQLSASEAELDSLLAPQSRASQNGNGTGTIDERILRILQERPGKTFDASEIHAAMDDVNIDSLRSALARMFNEEKIRKPERGFYQIL